MLNYQRVSNGFWSLSPSKIWQFWGAYPTLIQKREETWSQATGTAIIFPKLAGYLHPFLQAHTEMDTWWYLQITPNSRIWVATPSKTNGKTHGKTHAFWAYDYPIHSISQWQMQPHLPLRCMRSRTTWRTNLGSRRIHKITTIHQSHHHHHQQQQLLLQLQLYIIHLANEWMNPFSSIEWKNEGLNDSSIIHQ